MNYSEFSRQLLIDPRAPELAEAARQRVGADAPTQLAEALAFEHRIEQALAVAVPDGLAERILAALPETPHAIAPGARATRRWWPLALAASLAMVTLTATLVWRSTPAPSSTEQLIADTVKHLSHEPYALTRSDRVPTALVERMFAEAGLHLNQSGLALNYLNRCPLERSWSVHMVMQQASGPVTVMFVPGEQQVERMDTRHDMVAVRTLPYASGALVLLAESNQDFDSVENAWHTAAGDSAVVAAGGS